MFKFLPVSSEIYVCLTFRLKFNAYTFHIETFLIDSAGFFGGIRVVHLFSFMCCVVLLCFIYLRHACYAQYCLCLWIVHSYLPIRFSLTFI